MKNKKIIKSFNKFDKLIKNSKQNLNLYKYLEDSKYLLKSEELALKTNKLLEKIKKELEANNE